MTRRSRIRRALIAALVVLGLVGLGVGSALNTRRNVTSSRELDERRELVHRMERAITTEARDDGARVSGTRCRPVEDLGRDELTVPLGRYTCVAVTRETPRSFTGAGYGGTVDFRRGSFRFRPLGRELTVGG